MLQTPILGGPVAGFVFEGAKNAPELDRFIGQTVGEIAERARRAPGRGDGRLSLASDLTAGFLTKSATSDNAEFVGELLASPYVIPGVSDGGAHTKFLTAGSYTTDTLAWLVRDEKRMTLEEAHYKLSYLPARAAGFRDRGALVEGWPADVVVYDLARLKRLPEWWDSEVVHDFPGGEWRRIQRADGLPLDARERRDHVRERASARARRRAAAAPRSGVGVQRAARDHASINAA